MGELQEQTIISGNKRITELNPLQKLDGQEEILIDNGEDTYKTTVDTLLGYIAQQINAGAAVSPVNNSSNIIVIGEGEDIPIASRVDNTYYMKVCSSKSARISAGLSLSIGVSPNMSLRLVND